VPRVLVLQRRLDVDGVDQVVAADGDDALARFAQQPCAAVVVDLRLPPLDGWCVLAALGVLPDARRPRLVAVIGDRAEMPRARGLGAELCVLAGTPLHARALHPACRPRRATSSRPPMTSGVPA